MEEAAADREEQERLDVDATTDDGSPGTETVSEESLLNNTDKDENAEAENTQEK